MSSAVLNISTLTPTSFVHSPARVESFWGKVNPRKRKRNRKVLVCQPCHRHKQKCDRGLPCSRCVAAERPDQCVYDAITIINGREKMGAEHLIIVDEDYDTAHSSPIVNGDVDMQLDSTGDGTPATQNGAAQPVVVDRNRSRPKKIKNHSMLYYTKGKMKYSGATHWAQLVFQFDEMRTMMLKPGSSLGNFWDMKKATKAMYPPRKVRSFPFGDAVGHPQPVKLPSRQVVEAVVDAYFNTIEKLFPMFNPTSFREELAQFYEDDMEAEQTWIAQLFLILALGAYANPQCSLDDYPRGNVDFSERMVDGAEAAFATTPFLFRPHSGGFATIRVLCLISIGKQMDIVCSRDADSAWQYAGFVVRQAMIMLLHRNPDDFDMMPPGEADIRKRIWMTVSLIDYLTAVDAGMQTQVRTGDCDTPPPAAPPDNVNSDDNFYFEQLGKAMPLLLDTISSLNSPSPEISYQDVLKVDKIVREILNCFECPNVLDQQRLTFALDLQRTVMSTFLRRILLAIHQPWARAEDRSPHYEASHWAILECALCMVRRHQYLRDDPNMQWASVLLNEDFKLSIIHVCLGLRRKHFSDKPQNGALKSAKELAWDMVRFVYESTKENVHRDIHKMKLFMGISSMKAVLEAIEKDEPFDPVELLSQTAKDAWMFVQERMQAVKSAAAITHPDGVASPVGGWSPASMRSNMWDYHFWRFDASIDPKLVDGVDDGLLDYDSPYNRCIQDMFLN